MSVMRGWHLPKHFDAIYRSPEYKSDKSWRASARLVGESGRYRARARCAATFTRFAQVVEQ